MNRVFRRVGELEEENARLLALTQGSMANANTSAEPHSQGSTSPALSEIEQLRAQLAAAQERERQLCATIAAVSTSTAAVAPAVARAIKAEETPIVLPPAPPAPPSLISRSSFPSPSSAIKSGTGLGLMVRLVYWSSVHPHHLHFAETLDVNDADLVLFIPRVVGSPVRPAEYSVHDESPPALEPAFYADVVLLVSLRIGAPALPYVRFRHELVHCAGPRLVPRQHHGP